LAYEPGSDVDTKLKRIIKGFMRMDTKEVSSKIDKVNTQLSAEIKEVHSKIDLVNSLLSAEIKGVSAKMKENNNKLGANIDKLSAEMKENNKTLLAEMKEMNNNVNSLGLGLAIIATLAGVLGKGDLPASFNK
jgi:FKBP-type peptidyl-prolyl cis-trans isomerase (trigger factor)